MIKSITISVEEDSGSTTWHTVSTKEEALALIDRYFPKVKIGDKVRILTDGGYSNGSKYVGTVRRVERVILGDMVECFIKEIGAGRTLVYDAHEYEVVKE